MSGYDLSRFSKVHQWDYPRALAEIRQGEKKSHWMWYIFPQLRGLGHSARAHIYGLADAQEAKAFVEDEYLGGHLREISQELLKFDGDIKALMGDVDAMKLRSCMTLFVQVAPEEPVWQQVLDKFFDGKQDELTLKMLAQEEQ
ncbi:DUF1810 domain-containing protein [bacterium]|nr:DUF1810 domain-containing protein [bacterium]MBQ6435952.1 DUF1810 domain-containing protein [bacterium]